LPRRSAAGIDREFAVAVCLTAMRPRFNVQAMFDPTAAELHDLIRPRPLREAAE